jgi:hypothetical protein
VYRLPFDRTFFDDMALSFTSKVESLHASQGDSSHYITVVALAW